MGLYMKKVTAVNFYTQIVGLAMTRMTQLRLYHALKFSQQQSPHGPPTLNIECKGVLLVLSTPCPLVNSQLKEQINKVCMVVSPL